LVDWSEFCFTPTYRTAVAGTAIEVDQAEWRTLRVASTGPVWLPSGISQVVITSWQVGFRECRQVVRLRVGGLPVRVVIPQSRRGRAVFRAGGADFVRHWHAGGASTGPRTAGRT
jgi:hypothetical protein